MNMIKLVIFFVNYSMNCIIPGSFDTKCENSMGIKQTNGGYTVTK